MVGRALVNEKYKRVGRLVKQMSWAASVHRSLLTCHIVLKGNIVHNNGSSTTESWLA
jgi:hypothetical protein